MATAPPARNGTRKHKGSSLTSWLKKGTAPADAEAKKLASPAEEIKMVFLRQLKLSSLDLDGKQYHSVFTGAQIVDIILDHFKLPDRRLAANVASRLIDCSLYTHVSGPSCAAGACPAPSEVIDSSSEIYALTAEAEGVLRSIRGSDGLHRAKTHTRKRYQELRNHLHPRSDSHSSRSSPSTQSSASAARASSVLSSSSKESAASRRHPHPSPSLPAPLDVRRAREASTPFRGRDRASVADSMASDDVATPGSRVRRSPGSPSDTLVSHGPLTAPSLDPAQEQGCILESPSTAGEQRSGPALPRSSSTALANQLQGVDIPTGCLDGLPNTWSFVVDTPAASSRAASSSSRPSAQHSLPPSKSFRESDPVTCRAPLVCGAEGARASAPAGFMSNCTHLMGESRIGVGADASTTASNHSVINDVDADANIVADSDDSDSQRGPPLSSVECLARGSMLLRFGQAVDSELGSGSGSGGLAYRPNNLAPRSSCFSDYTITRYSSMPSISEQLSERGQYGSPHTPRREVRQHDLPTRQSMPRSCDEDWLAELLSASQSASRFSVATGDEPYAKQQHAEPTGRSMHSLASSQATSEYVPFESTVQLNVAHDRCRVTPPWRRRQRRHSIGTQADAPIIASHSGGSSRMLTPVTLRSSIAGPASEPSGQGGDRASRSSMYLNMLADAFSGGDRELATATAAGSGLCESLLTQNSIPNFPRPPYHCGAAPRGCDSLLVGDDGAAPQASAIPIPLSADAVNTWDPHRASHGGLGPKLRELPSGSKRLSRSQLARGTVLVRRQITPDRLSTSTTQNQIAADGSECSEGTASTSTPEERSRRSESPQKQQHPRDEAEQAGRDGGLGKRISCNLQLQLWRDTVPTDVLQALSQETIAQQEAIYEIICTEQGYLRDLELIDPVFVGPLLESPAAMEPTQAIEFVQMLFFNYRCLIANSRELCARLEARQAMGAVVQRIGDIFDEWADSLGVFVEYAVHVPVAQCELEAELLRNEGLAQFLLDAEAAPMARRLPIQSFLGRPATRLARYPLLLNAIIKRCAANDDDEARRLQSAADKVRRALTEIDRLTGEAAGRLRMRQISQRLRLVKGARESLALDSPSRQLIKEGVMYSSDGHQVLVFLFDNSLIMAVEERVPYAKNISRYAADERIIPISMLDVSVPATETGALMGIRGALGLQPTGRLARDSSSSSSMRGWVAATGGIATGGGGGGAGGAAVGVGAAGRQPLTFVHIGCRSLSRTLLVASDTERAQWAVAVSQRICVPQTLVEAYTDLRLLSDRDFPQGRVPLCSAPFVSILSGCQMVLFGNKDGLHMGIYGVPTSVVRVSNASNVTKIHIMKKYNMAVVLSDSNLLVFALSEIEKATAQVGVGVVGTRIASSVAFFDVGTYMGSPLVVLMKVRGGKSHFKCIQPQANPDEAVTEAAAGASAASAAVAADGSGSERRGVGSPGTSEKSDDDNAGGSSASSSSGGGRSSAGNRRRETASEPPPNVSLAAAAAAAAAPVHAESVGGSLHTLRVVYQGADAQLRLIGEFVVPGKTKRVHFLRRKLCIVGTRSFEIVDVQQGRVLRSLPDPLDDDFSFLHALDCGQAMAICKVGREFLLCYESFAFFIDNFGRRSRLDVFIRWEMRPQLITFRHPYIVAISQRFLEIRHIETGVLLSIIRIKHAQCLNPDSRSTILHLAIGPEPLGVPADAAPLPWPVATQQSESSSLSSDSEGPRATAAASGARPSSMASIALAKSAAVLATAPATGHIVPGLAGITGKSLFPEAIPGHYRIIEVRLPPLKPSAKAPSTGAGAD